MMPVLAYNLLQAIDILTNVARNFSRRCIEGIVVNADRCRELAERTLATVTALVPTLGYDRAAEIAKRAFRENQSVRAVAEKMAALSQEELDRLLDLAAMTRPGL
jgi:fumarate hydratase class II